MSFLSVRGWLTALYLYVRCMTHPARRHFPEAVKVVPRVNEFRFFPFFSECLHNSECGDNLPEIAEVDFAGGADAGGANELVSVGMCLMR